MQRCTKNQYHADRTSTRLAVGPAAWAGWRLTAPAITSVAVGVAVQLLAGCAAFTPDPPPEPPRPAVVSQPPVPAPEPESALPAEPQTAFLGVHGDKSGAGIAHLTSEELAVCAERSQRIDSAYQDLDSLRAALEHRRRDLKKRGNELAADRGEINPRRTADVKTFNGQALRHQHRVDHYYDDLRWYNEQAATTLRAVAEFPSQCAQRPYAVADLENLSPPLRTALARTAKPFDLPVVLGDGAEGRLVIQDSIPLRPAK